jgi:hypothetical protein
MSKPDLTAAIKRRKAAAAIEAILSSLTADDQRLVLLDLLATDAIAEGPGSLPFMGVRFRRGTHHRDQLLRELMMTPRMRIGELAKRIYGDDSALHRNRVRSMLLQLKRQGRVRPGPYRGEWEVVA